MKMINLHELMNDIAQNNIILPDFQRNFVWKDVERQKRLLASVLSSLPIGTILLLEGRTSEFSSKKIGRRSKLQFPEELDKKYLLDGQQRVTVLVNAFSNIILKEDSWGDLTSHSLKNRFYLTFPVIEQLEYENDIYGLGVLKFPFNPDVEDPNFLTEQVLSYIDSKQINRSEPSLTPFLNLDEYFAQEKFIKDCSFEINPILPLYLISDENGNYVFNEIIKKIATRRERYLNNISQSYFDDGNNDYIDYFVDKIPNLSVTQRRALVASFDSASNHISMLTQKWIQNFITYFYKAISNLKLNRIEVEKSQRARAIDIYENLNLGGISLSTFDLIIARAANTFQEGFYDAFVTEMKKTIDLSPNFKPDGFNSSWDSVKFAKSFSESNNEISNMYINVFMNLLSLITKKSENQGYFDFELSHIKRETILAISSSMIIGNYKEAIKGINRALAFAQFRLGIRKISEIKYEHVLLVLSYFLLNDSIYLDAISLDKLECWYWTSIFAGMYDKDQSSQLIRDLRNLDGILNKNASCETIRSNFPRIFSEHYFTHKDLLLMRNATLDNFPKDVVKQTICQFILSRRPIDFLKKIDARTPYRLKAWDIEENYEIHHVLPNSSSVNISESSQLLRSKKDNILNSPLNFTVIHSETNKKISNMALNDYYSMIQDISAVNHFIIDPGINFKTTDQQAKWLEKRYDFFRDSLLTYLVTLL